MALNYYYVITDLSMLEHRIERTAEYATFLVEPDTGPNAELAELQAALGHASGEAMETLNGQQAAQRLGVLVANNEPWELFDSDGRERGKTFLTGYPENPCLDWWSNAEPEIENQAISDACIKQLRQVVKESRTTASPGGGGFD